MKRFLSNVILGLWAFIGLTAMAGAADFTSSAIVQLACTFGGFCLAAWSLKELGIRLASHLPDEEV